MNHNYYKVGGSLKANHPTYVFRQGDKQLLAKLTAKEYCCVFNSRQMGKSSLRIQTMKTLRKKGVKCASIDLTILGSHVSQEQWYQGFAYQILAGFDLEDEIDFTTWWRQQEAKTDSQKLLALLELILEIKNPHDLVIFIDEIDSLIGVSFKDDIFALIRCCYNLRAENIDYNRLTFCLLGVATPSDLIEDKQRTPFNISYSLELTGFTLEEAKPALIPGLTANFEAPEAILTEILAWTGGQPFLTQKLCRIVTEYSNTSQPNIDDLVKQYILDNWEYKDQPEHFKTICDRLLNNETKAIQLLGLYQQVLLSNIDSSSAPIIVDSSPEQMELRLSGIVGIKRQYLQVYNCIYKKIFHLNWVQDNLAKLRPYSGEMNAWIKSNYNPSYLLKSESLEQVIKWSDTHKLSWIDYQFITASQQFFVKQESLEKEAKIKANLLLQKANKKARMLVRRGGIFAGILVISSFGFAQYQLKQANIFQLTANMTQQSYNAQQQFTSQQLNGLLSGMKAGETLNKLVNNQLSLEKYPSFSPVGTLLTILSEIHEFNQISTTLIGLSYLQFNPQGDLIAVAGENQIKILSKKGALIEYFKLNSEERITGLMWSEDNQKLMVTTNQGGVKVWNRKSRKMISLSPYQGELSHLKISPNGQMIAIVTLQGFLELRQLNGTLIKRFPSPIEGVTTLSFSANNQMIAVGTEYGNIQLWDIRGNLRQTLSSHQGWVTKIRFSADHKQIATGSDDHTVKLWDMNGKLLKTLEGHQGKITDIRFHPDHQLIASSSTDQTIKLWQGDGTLIRTLSGHNDSVTSLDFSPDGDILLSGSASQTIKLWKLTPGTLHKLTLSDAIMDIDVDGKKDEIIISDALGNITRSTLTGTYLKTFQLDNQLLISPKISPQQDKIAIATTPGIIKLFTLKGKLIKTIQTDNLLISSLNFHPKKEMITIGTDQGNIELYDLDGTLITRLTAHQGWITSVAFHPQGNLIASGSENGLIKLWKVEGTLIKELTSHQKAIKDLKFSPDGKFLISASADQTLKLWTLDGNLITTLTGHTQSINTVVFNPNGSMIASGSDEGIIKLWGRDGTPLVTLKASETSITSLHFTTDGLSLISGDEKGVLTVWPLQIEALLTQGCFWLQDYFFTHPQQKQELHRAC